VVPGEGEEQEGKEKMVGKHPKGKAGDDRCR
jgi:hypothetical protein